MGTAFTIDTPIRVARYGISSVVSLVDDVLIEQMRKHHSEREGEPYEEIAEGEDVRARSITAYLDLLDRILKRQVEALQASPFEEGSEITRYFAMLPESPLKDSYLKMLSTEDPEEKARLQEGLRAMAVPGSIDVNIMTKVDRTIYRNGEKLPPEFNDAMSALRGYANSTLRSSIVFSAGMNMRLYGYAARFDDFFPDEKGVLKKKVTLKVSDYRSAEIQGKFLAKRGIWVSEYRIESGLNCGGHAFATNGYLLGPIMEEFKEKKGRLIEAAHAIYCKALASLGRPPVEEPLEVRITVQGGIGTASENELMLKYYNVDSTGWGTPFLLVPEVTSIDEDHLKKLSEATEKEVYLSDSSPFGLPFWNMRNSASEEARRRRIREDRPGSPCPKGFLKMNSEFTKIPVCIASRSFVKRKLQHILEEGLSDEQLPVVKKDVLAKSCICHDLAGGATLKYGIDPEAKSAICTGPNIANFSRIATLEEMVGHIYGKINLLTTFDRPHMLIKELMLYVDFLRKELDRYSLRLSTRTPRYFTDFKENLLSGIENYRKLAEQFIGEQKTRFLDDLKTLQKEIEQIPVLAVASEPVSS
jgi:hypothetical protein